MTGQLMMVVLVKVSLLVAVTMGVVALLGRHSAVRRHRLWSLAFAALLAMPALSIVLPSIRIPIPALPTRRREPASPPPLARAPVVSGRHSLEPHDAVSSSVVDATMPAATRSWPRMSAWIFVAGLWMAGVAIALGRLALSIVRVSRLRNSGTTVDAPDWQDACQRISRRLRFTRAVRVVASPAVTTPMAGGLVHPTVFVPLDATTWSLERREIVLAHEIAHLASGDPQRLLISRLAFALYWFHPLVWVAARNALNTCEEACDEIVLALGVTPSIYAAVLLEFAETASARVHAWALPIVRPTLLETRLMAILSSTPRSIGSRRLMPGALLSLAAITIAAARPAVQDAATVAPSATTMSSTSVVGSESATDLAAPATRPLPARSIAGVTVAAAPVAPSAIQPTAECRWSASGWSSFSGTISSDGSDHSASISEVIGRSGSDRVAQTTVSDVRVCAVAEGLGDTRDDVLPSAWIGRASRVVLETRQGSETRRMEITGNAVIWMINGAQHAVDGSAMAWRERLLDVLDPSWQINQLRGRESTLRGKISTIYGQRSTLLGQISTYRGEVSSMQGEISTARGEESSLRGEISSIRGHLSSLNGEISSERGTISSLQVSRDVDANASIRRHEARIQDIEDEIRRYDADGRIRDVQRRLDSLDTDGRIAAIERRIRDFDLDAKIADVNRQLANLDVDGRVRDIERQISDLDVDRQVQGLSQRKDEAVKRLIDALHG